jgi:hypothetical protein
MAFDKSVRIQGTQDAIGVLASLRSVYSSMKQLQALVGRYVSGLEPEFTSAVDALFTVEEIGELGVILGKMGTWASDLETNHSDAIGL